MAHHAAPLTLGLDAVTPGRRRLVGGKGYALARLAAAGLAVPRTLCLTTQAYRRFVGSTGLLGRIVLEIGRKPPEQMRWEEMWDTALRIRSLFDRTPLPPELASSLSEAIDSFAGSIPMAVRSSALGEDSARASFAGLHESYLNVRGTAAILEHVRKVWASLWSDAALLYRQELGLEVERSAMAVVVQELVEGEVSGVAFGRSPLEPSEAVIEAVSGLNQALVDGAVEPDRWILRRKDGAVLSHRPGERGLRMVTGADGVVLAKEEVSETASDRQRPLLSPEQIQLLYAAVRRSEELFGSAQDVEWTFRGGALTVLQSRPITSGQGARSLRGPPAGSGDGDRPGPGSRRSWYLSLRRSFDNLKSLRGRIEGELIPEMIAEGQAMAGLDLRALTDQELGQEILRRRSRLDHWVGVYWEEFIPYAHGVRLFGRVYNDRLRPHDPFEFIEALRPATLESLERNRLLDDLAGVVRRDPGLARQLRSRAPQEIEHPEFRTLLEAFLARAGSLSFFPGAAGAPTAATPAAGSLSTLLLEMAAAPESRRRPAAERARKAQAFLESFPPEQREHGRELLELGRSSYRLRDDDNLYLGRIEQELQRAVGDARVRLAGDTGKAGPLADLLEAVPVPRHEAARPGAADRDLMDRQLVGQPAGDGLATGTARVIVEPRDLFSFKRGEILVCDALDPNMTFVIPLAAAVVERRGGMLIHGAIIAREYGIPCVTGIPELTARVPDGARVTVDGYLGILVIHGLGRGGSKP